MMDESLYLGFSFPDNLGETPSCQSSDTPFYKIMKNKEVQTDFPYPERDSSIPMPRKRGRKPSKAQREGCKKKEERDKFWLRAFRAYIKSDFPRFKTTIWEEEKSFWKNYLSKEGKPETSSKCLLRRFRSYGKQYKDYLFSHSFFQKRFQDWLNGAATSEVADTEWTESVQNFMLQYARDVLVHYEPTSDSVLKAQKLSEGRNNVMGG